MYIIAELSGNHGGKYENMVKLVEAAAKAGCDAIKLQTYKPEDFIGPDEYKVNQGLWKGKDLYTLYQEGMTPWEWHKPLFELAESLGLDYFSTPFSLDAVDFLEELGVKKYKIASFEILYHPLIQKVAETGKPIIISTGMSSLEEIRNAVMSAHTAGARDITLLQCSSSYPAPRSSANLVNIRELQRAFPTVKVGFSDHTLGVAAAVASVGFGASMIEKHFCLNRETGIDAAFSATPTEMKMLTQLCKEAEESVGKIGFQIKNAEYKNLIFRRRKIGGKWLRAVPPTVYGKEGYRGENPEVIKYFLGKLK